MARSGRKERERLFDPANKQQLDDAIDTGWTSGGQSPQTNLREVPKQTNVVEISAPPPPAPPAAPPAVDRSNVAALPPRQVASGVAATRGATRPPAVKRVTRSRRRNTRPPEASIAYSVYTRLLAVSADEKHQKGLAARPYGVIVMDALDRHAAQLEKHWSETPADSPVSNSLFVRSDVALLRRRRTGSKKTIPLSGISLENRRLLDRYAQEWHAGGRSALVEEALRMEFGMQPSDDASEDDGS